MIERYHKLLDNRAVAVPPPSAIAPGSQHEMDDIKKRLDAGHAWWTDLAEAEACIVELLNDNDVRAGIASWRRRLHEVLGNTRFAMYMSVAPDVKTADPAVLRADLSELMSSVYYFYTAYGVAARSRSDVTSMMLKWSSCIILAIVVFGWLFFALQLSVPGLKEIPQYVIVQTESLLAVAVAGIFGSVVSVQRRLQDPSVDVDPFFRYIQTRGDRLSVAVISPIFGAIFGAIMYALLASQLLGGNAFPQFDVYGTVSSVSNFFLMLVYGFTAGFAEQLIPDTLTRLAARTLGAVDSAFTPTGATGNNGGGGGAGSGVARPGIATSGGAATVADGKGGGG